MRFIHHWSYAGANLLMKQLSENHEKRRVYYYGFQIVIGALVKGTLLLSITLLLGTLIPTLLIVLVFGSLRMLAGGYHMDTYGKCIITSLLMFIVFGTIAQYTYSYWSIANLTVLGLISFALCIFVLLKWAPKDTPNKPITNPGEIKKLKRLSLLYVLVWLIATSVLVYLRVDMKSFDILNKYIISGCFGLLLEIFTITPVGHLFFDRISGKAGHIKTNE